MQKPIPNLETVVIRDYLRPGVAPSSFPSAMSFAPRTRETPPNFASDVSTEAFFKLFRFVLFREDQGGDIYIQWRLNLGTSPAKGLLNFTRTFVNPSVGHSQIPDEWSDVLHSLSPRPLYINKWDGSRVGRIAASLVSPRIMGGSLWDKTALAIQLLGGQNRSPCTC